MGARLTVVTILLMCWIQCQKSGWPSTISAFGPFSKKLSKVEKSFAIYSSTCEKSMVSKSVKIIKSSTHHPKKMERERFYHTVFAQILAVITHILVHTASIFSPTFFGLNFVRLVSCDSLLSNRHLGLSACLNCIEREKFRRYAKKLKFFSSKSAKG